MVQRKKKPPAAADGASMTPRAGGGGGASPALITANVKNAKTIDELFYNVQRFEPRLNHIHLSACWGALARMTTLSGDAPSSSSPSSPSSSWRTRHAAVVAALVARTISILETSAEVRGREVANIAHGVAKCGLLADVGGGGGDEEKNAEHHQRHHHPNNDPHLHELMDAIAAATLSRAWQLNAQELANATWAFAKVEGSSCAARRPSLLDALSSRLRRESEKFTLNPQELANASWALATCGRDGDTSAGSADAPTFAALARATERSLHLFTPRGVSNAAHAFAKASVVDAALFQSLARVATDHARRRRFNALDLANVAWAFAAKPGGGGGDELWRALSDAVILSENGKLSDAFNARGVATTAWAFAKAGAVSDAALFETLARRARETLKSRPDDDNPAAARCVPQDVANIAWAFAKACHADDALFDAVAARVRTSTAGFNTQDLVNVAWAFAKTGRGVGDDGDRASFAAISEALLALPGGTFDALTAPQLANVAWAFAKANDAGGGSTRGGASSSSISSISSPFASLFAALARSAASRANDFSAQELTDVAWAFANAGCVDGRLFAAFARRAETLADDFDDEELDNAEWAFARAGQHGIAKKLKRLKAGKKKNGGGGGGGGADDDDDDDGDDDDEREKSKKKRSKRSEIEKCGVIVVAGGGIGGAAVAVALQREGFKVLVLEGDASFDARKQGYGLTIQRLDAIGSLGIDVSSDDAPSTSHYAFDASGGVLNFYGEAFAASAGKGCRRRKERENSGRFVHIPRQRLRERILAAVAPGTVRWGCKLESFKEWSEKKIARRGGVGGVSVTTSDGAAIDASLLIGSDGIHSVVRKHLRLPNDRLNYVGLIVVLGIVRDDAMCVTLAKRRVFETVDGSTRIYAMPFTTNSTMWQLSFPMSEQRAKALSRDPTALKRTIAARCEAWHDPIPAMLARTSVDDMSGYPVYDRDVLDPIALRPPSDERAMRRRVTIIGDAAHPMTPFKAQGANQAISDAALLAECLACAVGDHGHALGVERALPIFEKKMLRRSARAVIASREKAREMHSKLALGEARKSQRESDVDVGKVVRALRRKNVGAATAATDPRGLDAVVAEVVAGVVAGGDDVEEKGEEEEEDAGASAAPPGKKRKKRNHPVAAAEPGGGERTRCWARFEDDWHKCVVVRRDATSAVVEWKGGKRLAVPLSDVRDRVWAFYDDDWRKSTVVKIKKKTGARVIELPGGEKKSIPAERVKPMLA